MDMVEQETVTTAPASTLSAWDRVKLARHAERPHALDYVRELATDWVELHGDRSFGDDRALVDLSGRDVRITVDLAAGDAQATIWTNDLTADYVHENSAYAT